MSIMNKVFLRGRLRGFDAEKSTLSNVGPSSLITTLTSSIIVVDWEALLVEPRKQDPRPLGGTPDVRYNLAIFRDV